MNIKKELKNVYVNESKKIVVAVWKDGTKTFAECSPDDNFSMECGVLICYLKKVHGNSGFYGLMGDLMEKVKVQNKTNPKTVQKQLKEALQEQNKETIEKQIREMFQKEIEDWIRINNLFL